MLTASPSDRTFDPCFGRIFGFSQNNCPLSDTASLAVHRMLRRWNRFLVADDKTNTLVHDTSITLRVAYPLSVQPLRFATPACLVSPLLVSLTSRCDVTRRSASERRQPGNLVSNWKLCRDIIPLIIEIAFTGALCSAQNVRHYILCISPRALTAIINWYFSLSLTRTKSIPIYFCPNTQLDPWWTLPVNLTTG